MARERVQVQGLGGAVPGISPTIQRAGQYSVQVQRAGRNKLMDLADALGQVNPVLQQYTRVADLEAEQFEEELAGKSPEEVQAMLKQTEGELDKQVRRGGMGWLTSPLNQKRKLKAVGKLASRDLVNEIEARLINPKQGDPEDLTERANLVRQEFIDNTPALQSSVFAQEGLNRSSNTRIQETVANYERREEAIARSETLFATESAFYDKLETFVDYDSGDPAVNAEIAKRLRRGDFDFVIDAERDNEGNIIKSITLGDYLKEEWSNTNAYTAKEQRQALTKTLESMAQNGMGDQADGLLLWAKDNLKFGNADMSTKEYEDLESMIDRQVENEEERRDKDALDFVKDTTGEYKIKLTQLKYSEDGQIAYDGQTFSDKLALQKHFKQKVISNTELNNEQKGKLLDEISTTTQGSFRDSETYTKSLILKDAPEATAAGVGNQLQAILENIDIPDEYKTRAEVRNILYNAADRLNPKISQYMDNELLGLPQEKASEKARIYVRSLLEEEMPKIQASIKEAADLLDEEKKQLQKGLALGEEKPEEPQLPEPDVDPDQLIKLLPQWQSFVTKDPNDEKSNQAKKYIDQYTPELANDTAKLVFDADRYTGIGSMTAEEARDLHIQYASRMDGVFTVDVLENIDDNGFAYTYAGIKFKPKQLIGNINADKFVLLSEEQLENADTEEGKQVIERTKQAAGITLDTPEFIRLQRKRRKQYIVPYTPFPDSYRPIDPQKELEEFINKPAPAYDYFPLTDFLLMD